MNALESSCFLDEVSDINALLSSDYLFITGDILEPRQSWVSSIPPAQHCKVTSHTYTNIMVEWLGTPTSYKLTSAQDLSKLFTLLGVHRFVIDITTLPHHVWAPLLRLSIKVSKYVYATYVEPDEYVRSIDTEIYDLSEKIEGIRPIPGFVSLQDRFESNVCFVPFIGFERARFAFIMEQTQPPPSSTFPVVGVPGFRAEFPFHALDANAIVLLGSRLQGNIHFASANDPFSAFRELQSIAARFPSSFIKIAPIGTKPHALGAFLFPLKTQRQVEFVYDNPVRKPKRSSGHGKMFLYDITGFMGYAA